MGARIRSYAKRSVVALALWGVISPEMAKKIIQRMKLEAA